MLEDLAPGAGEPHRPVLEHHAKRAEPQARAGVLLHQEDRLALLVHQLHHREDDRAGLRVEAHRRLVENDHLRLEHQAARELHEALLPTRQAPGLLTRAVTDDRVQLLDRLQPLLHERVVLDGERAHLDVLAHRHLGEQAVRLGHLGDPPSQDLPGGQTGDELLAESDLAQPGMQQPADRGQ